MSYDFENERAAKRAVKLLQALADADAPPAPAKLYDFESDEDGTRVRCLVPNPEQYRIYGAHVEQGEWRVFWFTVPRTGGVPLCNYVTVDTVPVLQ